jgi:hypothetical protein
MEMSLVTRKGEGDKIKINANQWRICEWITAHLHHGLADSYSKELDMSALNSCL